MPVRECLLFVCEEASHFVTLGDTELQVKRLKTIVNPKTNDINLIIQKINLSIQRLRVIMHLVSRERPSSIHHVYFNFNQTRHTTPTSLAIYTRKLFLLDGKGWLTEEKENSFAWQMMFQCSINTYPH